jgi:hypothetical protein
MNLSTIALHRLHSQHLTGNRFRKVSEVVDWMGALQAQDLPMSKWALGIRLPGYTERMIDQALDEGEILRTHALRPTWHIVPSKDIRWILALTAPHIRTSMRARDSQLGITPQVIRRCLSVLEKNLAGGKHLERKELTRIFQEEGFAMGDNRMAHYLMHAELEGLICSGHMHKAGQTYGLLSGRVPQVALPDREKALEMLARKYFASHGPATLADFVWWSGLPVRDARKGLEMAGPRLQHDKLEQETYWFGQPYEPIEAKPDKVHLIPAYDEFFISYRNREACLSGPHTGKVISVNGFFRPLILINGIVTGLWKRTLDGNKLRVEAEYFRPQKRNIKQKVEEAALALARFQDLEVTVSHRA